MFTFLADAIDRALNFILKLYNQAKEGLRWFWAMLWAGFMTVLTMLWDWVLDKVNILAEKLAAYSTWFEQQTYNLGYVGPFLRAVNRLVPLDEIILGMVALAGVIIVLTAYRLIKSWIPTVSS